MYFSPQVGKKTNPPQQNFLYSRKMELSSSNIKRFLIFSQKKSFLIFQETKPPKKSLIFYQKKAISRKGNPVKILYFQKMELSYLHFRKGIFRTLAQRNFLIFWERYTQNAGLFRTRSIFRGWIYGDFHPGLKFELSILS